MPTDNSIDPALLAAGNASLLDQKKHQVAETTKAKQARLDPYSPAAIEARIARAVAKAPARISEVDPMDALEGLLEEGRRIDYDAYGRTGSDIVTDSIRNLTGSAATMVTGTLGAGLSLAGENLDPTRKIKAAAEALGMDVDVGPGYVAEAFGDAGRAVADVGSQIQRKLKSQNSWQAQFAARERDRKQQASKAEHQLTYDEAIAGGGNETWEGIKKFGRDVGTAARHTAEDPGLLFDTVVEQVPSLAGGLAARGMVGARAISTRAAELAAKEGLKEATPAMLRKAAAELGRGPLALTTGSMEAGGAYAQAVGEVLSLDVKQLAAQYPEVLDRLKAGESFTDIREDIADRVAMKSAVLQGFASAGIGQIAGRFALSPFSSGGIRETAVDVLKEGTEEMLQGASGALAQNVSEISEGNVQTKLSDDVADAMGTSLVAGMGMPVLTGSVGTAAKAGVATLSGLGETAAGTVKLLASAGKSLEGLAEARTKFKQKGAEAKAEHDQAVGAVADNVATRLANIPGMEKVVDALNAGGVSSLSEEQKASVNQLLFGNPEAPLESAGLGQFRVLTTLQSAARQIADGTMKVDPSTATAVNLQLMAVTRNVARARNNVLVAAEALPEGQARDELMSVYEAMGQPLYNTDLISGEEASAIPQEEINALVEGLPTPDKMVNLPPEQAEVMRNNMGRLKEIVFSNPLALTQETLQKMRPLYADLSEEDVAAFDRADELLRLQAEYRQKYAAVNDGNSKKTPDMTANDIRLGSFEYGTKGVELKSVAGYINEVSKDLSIGNFSKVLATLTQMKKFAEHQQKRAEAYDDAALSAIAARKDNPNAFEEKFLTGYGALDSETNKVSKKKGSYVLLNQHTSRRLIDAVRNDADYIAQNYNTLLTQVPAAQLARAGLTPMEMVRPLQWPQALRDSGFQVAQTAQYAVPGAETSSVPGSSQPAQPAQATKSTPAQTRQEPAQAAPVETAPVAAPEAKSSGQAEASEPVVVNSDSEPTEDDIEVSRARAEQEISKGETPSRRFMRGLKFKGTLGDQNFHLIEHVLGFELQNSNDEFTAEDFKKAFPFLSDEAAKASEERFADGAGLGEYVEILEAIEGRKELFDRNGNLFDEKPEPAKPATRFNAKRLARMSDSQINDEAEKLYRRKGTDRAKPGDEADLVALESELEARESRAQEQADLEQQLEDKALRDFEAIGKNPEFAEADAVMASIKGGEALLEHSVNGDTHTITATVDGELAGTLSYEARSDVALSVDVEEDFRRRGIAQAMYRFAAEKGNYLLGRKTKAGIKHEFKPDGVKTRLGMDITKVKLAPAEQTSAPLTAEQQALIDQANGLINTGEDSTAGEAGPGNSSLEEIPAGQAETAPAPKATMESTFPELPTSFRGGTDVQSQNRFLKAFRINGAAGSMMAKSNTFLRDLTVAARQGLSALTALMPESRLSAGQAEGVLAFTELTKYLFEQITDYQNQINGGVFKSRRKVRFGNLLEYFFNKDSTKALNAWRTLNRFGSHYLVQKRDAEGNLVEDLQMHPRVQQAMAVAAGLELMDLQDSTSLLDDDTFTKTFHEGRVPQEVLDQINLGAVLSRNLQNRMGNSVMRLLGLQVNPDASRTSSDGMRGALGGDALEVLVQAGLLQVNTISLKKIGDRLIAEASSGKEKPSQELLQWAKTHTSDMPFIQLTKAGENAVSSISSKNDEGNEVMISVDKLRELIDPESERRMHIGAPPKKRFNRKIQGVGNPASEEQNIAANNMEQAAYTVNKPMMDFLLRFMGGDNMRLAVLLGYVPEMGIKLTKKTPGNKAHASSLVGSNLTIWEAIRKAGQMFADLNAYAAANDMPVEKVPMHWTANVVSNGRIMFQGFSGQRDKLMRELATPYQSEISLEDPQHLELYYLTMIQAFDGGVDRKVHKSNQQRMGEWVEAMLSSNTKLGQVFRTLEKIGNSEEIAEEDYAKLTSLMATANFSNPARALHAMIGHLEFKKAQAAGDKSYIHRLPLELDGLTDGPINALMQFGLANLSEKIVSQLEMGGLFMGGEMRSTNDYFTSGPDGKRADFYGSVIPVAGERMRALKKEEPTLEPSMKATWNGLFRAGLMTRGFSKDLSGALFERKGPKGAIIKLVYGSGNPAVMQSFLKEITKAYYAELHKAAMTGQPISQELRQEILELFGQWPKARGKMGTGPFETFKFYKELDARLNDPANFEFNDMELDRAARQLVLTTGGVLLDAINSSIAPVKATFSQMYMLTEVHVRTMNNMFQERVNKKRKELIAAGELNPNDALSPNQEAEILKELAKFMPVYPLPQASGEGEGMLLGQRERNSVFIPEGATEAVAVTSQGGTFSREVGATVFGVPGVQIAPMGNIAAGDAAMMTSIFQKLRQMLNVYDGLEAGILDLVNGSFDVNAAVWKNWQSDMLTGIVDRLALLPKEEVTKAIDDMNAATLDRYHKNGWSTENLEDETFGTYSATVNALRYKAIRSNAVRIAMSELSVAVHHMAAYESGAYTKDGILVPREELADWINNRADELMGGFELEGSYNQDGSFVVENADGLKDIEERINKLREGGPLPADFFKPKRERKPTQLSEAALDAMARLEPNLSAELFTRYMDKMMAKSSNKVLAFVYKTLSKYVPSDLTVHFGTREEMLDLMRKHSPDAEITKLGKSGTYLNGRMYFVGNNIQDIKPEYLVHELLHATTSWQSIDYYFNGGKQLSKTQREAMQDLERLVNYLLTQRYSGDKNSMMRKLQGLLSTHVENKDYYSATQELMAWVMTNKSIGESARGTRGMDLVKATAKRVLSTIRKLVGLPQNPTMENFMEQVAGQFQRVVQRPVADRGRGLPGLDPGAYRQSQLFADLSEDVPGDPAHVEHLSSLATMIDKALGQLPDYMAASVQEMLSGQRVPTRNEAIASGSRRAQEAIDAGFEFTDQEKLLYMNLHAVFGTFQGLNSNAVTEIGKLYNELVKSMDELTFFDPDAISGEDERAKSFAKFNVIFRSDTALPTFMAMAMVNREFRSKLSDLKTPASKMVRDGGLDTLLRSAATSTLDLLNARPLDLKHKSGAPLVDHLMRALLETRQELMPRTVTARKVMEYGNEKIHASMDYGREIAQRATNALNPLQQSSTGFKKAVAGAAMIVTQGVTAALSTSNAQASAWAESILKTMNHAKLPLFVKEVVREMVGITGSNRDVYMHLDRVKQMVATLRQALLEDVPRHLRKTFEGEVSKADSKLMYNAMMRTDLQALQDMDYDAIKSLFEDQAALTAQIEVEAAGLTDGAIQKAKALGRYLVLRRNDTDPMLLRNARSIAQVYGGDTAQVDRLITLFALQTMPESSRKQMASIMSLQPEGVKGMLSSLRNLARQEADKAKQLDDDQEGHLWNAWKGISFVKADPRHDLVLANVDKHEEMLRQGYRLVGFYSGDSRDPKAFGMAYYATAFGGRATYNQGALQTVIQTMGGADAITGVTQASHVQTLIKDPTLVAEILNNPGGSGSNRLIPVYDSEGKVYAFERTVDPEMLSKYLREDEDIFTAVGTWTGRITEETLAQAMNAELVRKMKQTYDADVAANRGDEYIDITKSKDKVHIDTWKLVPENTKKMFAEEFEGPVMIRKDMINNAIGYRSASVQDLFTGKTRLPEDVRKGLETAAFVLAGKNAYAIFTTAEKAWQGTVGTAKDLIVVRSGVVAISNIIGNMFALMQMTGMNPLRLARLQAKKFQETETYLRNFHRLTQLQVDLGIYQDDADRLRQIQAEQRALTEVNRGLSIWPLIEQGLLPTIAEGLTQQDEYSLVGDGMKWIEEKASKLPPVLLTGVKYAMISKDTALYQGLNRMVQFGDFVAKAALYDYNTQVKKMNSYDALTHVSESFVNYNLLAGRGRDYLESMGLTWFYNYKLRVQKIILRNLRENPMSFLLGGMGAEFLGAESLFSSSAPATNWTYGLGPDQLFRSHEMLGWNQLMGAY